MKVIYGIQNLPRELTKSALSLGNFDGVHKGHQALLKLLVQRAHDLKIPSVVMTFDPHPVQVLYPDRKLKRLFSREDQIQRLSALGIDYLVIEPFTKDLARTKPDEFLNTIIVQKFAPIHLIVGHDFSFGAARAGSLKLLESSAASLGFELTIVPAILHANQIISSSAIRSALETRNLEQASSMLGRPFYLQGQVITGEGRGKNIGVATANVAIPSDLIVPGNGVYATMASVVNEQGVTTCYKSLTNIGTNPTFHEGADAPIKVECHLLDFDGSLTGKTLRITFHFFLREEKKFPNSEELVKQIRQDFDQGRKLLGKIEVG